MLIDGNSEKTILEVIRIVLFLFSLIFLFLFLHACYFFLRFIHLSLSLYIYKFFLVLLLLLKWLFLFIWLFDLLIAIFSLQSTLDNRVISKFSFILKIKHHESCWIVHVIKLYSSFVIIIIRTIFVWWFELFTIIIHVNFLSCKLLYCNGKV